MNLNLVVCLAMLVGSSFCLHLQHQEIYQKDEYQTSMLKTQDQFKSDLVKVRQIFQNIDQTLLSQTDENIQLSTLQEGLADERDELYNIQTYLNEPYNQRLCQCFNLSDEAKQQIEQQLSIVESSLNQLEAEVAEQCNDCEATGEIQLQIKHQKNYLKVMQDTINSKCCYVFETLLLDNLQAQNWVYGNFTQQKYQSFINQKVAIIESTGKNVTKKKCPLALPFVDSSSKKCILCSQEPLFNLQTKTCESCPIGKIYNYATHQCDYNRTCPNGGTFSDVTLSCQKNNPAINTSSCPPDRPFYNQEELGCEKCPEENPLYNSTLGKCTVCPDNTTWETSIEKCIHECEEGKHYEEASQSCVEDEEENQNEGGGKVGSGNPTGSGQENQNGDQDEKGLTGTTSICPLETPYWDSSSKSCSKCPEDKPNFNSTSKECVVCEQDFSWNSEQATCTYMGCSQNENYDEQTKQCTNKTTVSSSSENQASNSSDAETVGTNSQNRLSGTTSVCPSETPVWDSVSKSCSECPEESPYYNEQNFQCENCPSGSTYDQQTGSCKSGE